MMDSHRLGAFPCEGSSSKKSAQSKGSDGVCIIQITRDCRIRVDLFTSPEPVGQRVAWLSPPRRTRPAVCL